jgi:hypothetical protein
VVAGAGGAATAGQRLTPDQVRGLRDLFGNSVRGVQQLMSRIQDGAVTIPQSVTFEVLMTYRNIAEQAVSKGIDTLGVQAARIGAIDLLLPIVGK